MAENNDNGHKYRSFLVDVELSNRLFNQAGYFTGNSNLGSTIIWGRSTG